MSIEEIMRKIDEALAEGYTAPEPPEPESEFDMWFRESNYLDRDEALRVWNLHNGA